jgi:hypothetical protein
MDQAEVEQELARRSVENLEHWRAVVAEHRQVIIRLGQLADAERGPVRQELEDAINRRRGALGPDSRHLADLEERARG